MKGRYLHHAHGIPHGGKVEGEVCNDAAVGTVFAEELYGGLYVFISRLSSWSGERTKRRSFDFAALRSG